VARIAEYTAQVTALITGDMKKALRERSDSEHVSEGEVVRRWLDLGRWTEQHRQDASAGAE
jgi:hypothetical protein